jgi:3-oxoacyl-[acyl-carrier-protein] synthase-3
MTQQVFARIAGTGSYLPEKVLTNEDLSKIVDTSDEWIAARTGIRERHIAAEGETTSDLGYHAAVRALEAAGVDAKELDLIVVGTTTPDLIFPSTACLIQHRLGADGCPAFDVNAACSGFVYALTVADKFVRSGAAKTALVIGSETLTRMVDWSDRTTCVLFGDGAGAVVLKADTETGILSTHMHADGGKKELLWNPVGVSVGFKTDEPNAGVKIHMSGNDVFKHAVKALDSVVEETLAHHRSHGQAPGHADGARDRDRRQARQHVVRIGAARARRSGTLRQGAARPAGAVGSIRWRLHLGLGAVALLRPRLYSGTCFFAPEVVS